MTKWRQLTRQRQITKALEELDPPAAQKRLWSIEIDRLTISIEASRQIAVTKTEKDQCSAALQKFRNISAAYKGPRLVRQDILDRAVEHNKIDPAKLRARLGIEGPLPPLTLEFQVGMTALNLLHLRGHTTVGASPNGPWIRLTRILLNDYVSHHILRKILEFLRELKDFRSSEHGQAYERRGADLKQK